MSQQSSEAESDVPLEPEPYRTIIRGAFRMKLAIARQDNEGRLYGKLELNHEGSLVCSLTSFGAKMKADQLAEGLVMAADQWIAERGRRLGR